MSIFPPKGIYFLLNVKRYNILMLLFLIWFQLINNYLKLNMYFPKSFMEIQIFQSD